MDSEQESVKSIPRGLRKHARHVSQPRAVLPRRSTKGPLDAGVDDPLANNLLSSDSTPATSSSQQLDSLGIGSPRGASPVPPSPLPPVAPIDRDFSFLLRSEIYHPLNTVLVPAAFVPPPSSSPEPSLHYLLQTGRFRRAAARAASRLCIPPPPPPAELFSLLYTRLACVVLLNGIHLAASEALALGDLHSAIYAAPDPHNGDSILPWELRVLATRLQALAAGDSRQAIEGLYDLAAQARKRCLTPGVTPSDKALWGSRLTDLGLAVTNTLVEMGDWDGARRHLESLRSSKGAERSAADDEQDGMIRVRLALLCLYVGDLRTARSHLRDDSDGLSSSRARAYADAVRPLLSAAEGNFGSAVAQLGATLRTPSRSRFTQQASKPSAKEQGSKTSVSSDQREPASDEPIELNIDTESDVGDPLAMHNCAVCALYAGRLTDALALLDALVERACVAGGAPPRPVLFALATALELSSDRAATLKRELAERVAATEGSSHGWERGLADFKMT